MTLSQFCVLACLLLTAKLSAQDTLLEDTTLPILEIRTELGDPITTGFERESELYIYDNPSGLNQLTDIPERIGEKIFITFRGSSSIAFPKKNYGFEFRDSLTQTDQEVSVFGMPKHEDWALHGPYSDKSLMRNALAYKWAAEFMPWAPRTKYVDLVINGSYEGIYLFTERVKRDNDRVDVAKLDGTDTSGVDLTGGYILEIGDSQPKEFRSFFSQYSQVPGLDIYSQYQLDYPKFDSLAPNQFDYIKNYVYEIENRLAAPNYTDAATGYRNYIDVASWVDHALVQEISGNFDAYRRSTYMLKDRDDNGGRLAAGPAWDFNIAFGNEASCLGQTVAGWMIETNSPAMCSFRTIPFIVQQMYADPVFKARMRARWEGLRQNTFSDANINADIDSLVALLQHAQPADQRRWLHMGMYVWPNAYVGPSWEAEVDYLRSWILRRAAWIDTNIALWPAITNLQTNTSELPILRIEVAGGDTIATGRTDAGLAVINNGPDQVNSPEGSSTGYHGAIAIELVGAADEKSTYSFELRNADGDDFPYRLLDMPKEEDWILRGPYEDKSLVRNEVGLELARNTSLAYTPRSKAVVLYVNGSYDGIYFLTEEIKRDDSRVDIAKLRDDEISGDDLTGGYIIEVDGPKADPAEGFVSTYSNATADDRTFYAYHTPDESDIVAEQQAYIESEIAAFEDAISTGGFAAARPLMDEASFIDYMLVQELAASSKAYRRSAYLHKDKDSKNPLLVAGPVWDFRRGFGNDIECGGRSPQRWVVQENSRCDDDAEVPFWWRTLWLDSDFRQLAAQRWQDLRANAFGDDELREYVALATDPLRSEVGRNFTRYPILGQAIDRNAFVGQTYDEEVTYLTQWLLNRAAWMDANISTISGVSNRHPQQALSIFPNPAGAAGSVAVSFSTTDLDEQLGSSVRIMDALGRQVLERQVERGQRQVLLSVKQLPVGTYQVLLVANGGRVVAAGRLLR